jgi:predicted membrane protein DUF2142
MKPSPGLQVAGLLFLGAIFMQFAWTVTMPPFSGIDEFDHAYRASAVANGQWVAQPSAATRGTGAVLSVPRDIVSAAHAECENFPYTRPVDCTPQAYLGHGTVSIASGAGRYNPIFYWIIGTPSLPFHGATALYVMRAMSALLSSLFLALSGWALSKWARTRWPLVCLIIATTPVAIYSTAMPAPNGPEITAALALWCCLFGLAQTRNDVRASRALIWAAVPAAMALATLRSLGPMWLAMILALCLAFMGAARVRELLKQSPVHVAAASGFVLIAVVGSVAWIMSMKSLVIGRDPVPHSSELATILIQLPLWLLQSIASFPSRNTPAPTLVYACCLVVGVSLNLLAWFVAARRVRLALLAVLTMSALVPTAITLATFDTFGTSWQGRYTLPFSVGLLLLCGLALERSALAHRLARPALACGGLVLFIANAVGITHVLAMERSMSPQFGTSTWHTPATWMVVLLMAVGWLCWANAVRLTAKRSGSSRPREEVRVPVLEVAT